MPGLAEVAPGVLAATSETMMTTTTVVAGPRGGCLVIDPAVTVADLAWLAAELPRRGLTPVAGFATHPHWDHVLWSAGLGDVPRYASATAAAAVARDRATKFGQAEEQAPGHDPRLFGQLVPLPGDGAEIPWDGPAAQVIVHDGHAPGHAAVFFPGPGVLVAGDMLSDVEIPLLDLDAPAPLASYRAGLDRLASVPGVRWVVPGHGRTGDAAEFRRRCGADAHYLARLAAGQPFTDPRLSQDGLADEHQGWLESTHCAQIRFSQRSRGGPGLRSLSNT